MSSVTFPASVARALRMPGLPLACLTSALAAVPAVVAMVGWIGRWTPLVRLDPGLPAMQFNTALLLAASAAGVALDSLGRRGLAVSVGGVVLVFAAMTLFQHATGVNLGIDTLFVQPFIHDPRWATGRMAPQTAAALTCVGVGLVASLHAPVRSAAAGVGSFVVIGLAGSALLQYAFGAGATSFRGRLGGTSIQTAAGLVLIAGGWLSTAWVASARRGGWPTWLPAATAMTVLLVSALLAQTLVAAFPGEGTRLVFATVSLVGATIAALAFGAVRAAQVSQDRADAISSALLQKQASEERNRVLFEQSSAGIVELDASSRFVRANGRYCDLVGRSEAELRELCLGDITHPDDRTDDASRLALGFANALPREGWTRRYIRPDGSVVWVRVSGSRLSAAPGGEPTLIGVVQDITELVEAQSAIARSRAHLVAFVEHAPVAVAMFDRDLHYIAVSRRWKDDYGLSDQPLIGRHHYDVFPEILGMPEWQAVHQRCLAGAIERCDENHFVRADGRDEWIQWEVRPWFDPHGAIGGVMMLTEVITPRKLAARALAESQQRLQLALSNARHGLWDWNIETAELFVDDQCAAIVGYNREELDWGAIFWTELVHPDDAAGLRAALDRALASDEGSVDADYRARTKAGGWVWVNTRGRVQARDAAGGPLRMMGTIHDITGRKVDEQRIRDALHVNEVLLREVHHRVKNNLAAIGSLFYLQAQTTTDTGTLALLEDCRNRVHSMSLVHELFYRSADLAVVDLADYAASLVNHLMSGQSAGPSIRLVTRLEPVQLDVDRAIPCGLVLNEMLTNALKHAFRGREAGAIEVALAVRDGRCLLSVIDDGVGPGAVDATATRSMGLRLMRALAGQLDARFDLGTRSDGTGTRAELEFPCA